MVTDVVVIGGGLVGLMTALELAGEGLDVTVVDAGSPGANASTRAAGVLAPLIDHRKPRALLNLCRDGLEVWPAWLETWDLAAQVAIRRGLLAVAETASRGDALRELVPDARLVDSEARVLSRDVLHREIGGLGQYVEAALVYPGAGLVDARLVYRWVLKRAEENHVKFRWGQPVLGIELRQNRARGARIAGQVVPGGAVVLASGAASGLLVEPMGLTMPVLPVRGTLVAVEGVPAPPCPIFGQGRYLIPREDGVILVGGTEERVGFQSSVTLGGLRRIAETVDLYPALATAQFVEAWAGLRPGTPDGLPYLGWWPDIEGLFVATGHFQNGILLGPLTAELVTASIIGAELPIDLGPFRPDRYRNEDWPVWVEPPSSYREG